MFRMDKHASRKSQDAGRGLRSDLDSVPIDDGFARSRTICLKFGNLQIIVNPETTEITTVVSAEHYDLQKFILKRSLQKTG